MGSTLQPPGQPGPLGPEDFVSASVPNLVTFKTKGIEPPTALYIQRDDKLLLTAISSTPNATITVTLRLWLANEGRITSIQRSMTITGQGFLAQSLSIDLAEGYLLSATVFDSGSVAFQATYVELIISRDIGTFPPPVPGNVLIAGYCAADVPAFWPGGGRQYPGDGPGNKRVVSVTNPSAGADWSRTGQSFAVWEIEYFNAVLTTSAVPGNRNVQLELTDGTTVTWVGNPSGSIPASTTANVSGSPLNVTSTVIATNIFVPFPARTYMTSADVVKVVTVNLDAADQWSAIRLLVREWVLI